MPHTVDTEARWHHVSITFWNGARLSISGETIIKKKRKKKCIDLAVFSEVQWAKSTNNFYLPQSITVQNLLARKRDGEHLLTNDYIFAQVYFIPLRFESTSTFSEIEGCSALAWVVEEWNFIREVANRWVQQRNIVNARRNQVICDLMPLVMVLMQFVLHVQHYTFRLGKISYRS